MTGKNNTLFGFKHSKKTKHKMSEKAKLRTGNKNSNWKGGKTFKKYYCNCGEEISFDNALYGKGHCRECYLVELKKRLMENNPLDKFDRFGKSNPNYIHGESRFPYPIEFSKKLKRRIKERDNGICQNCKDIGSIIHHIDYDKDNCVEINLVTLCNKCHSKSNFNRDYWYAFYSYKIGEKYETI